MRQKYFHTNYFCAQILKKNLRKKKLQHMLKSKNCAHNRISSHQLDIQKFLIDDMNNIFITAKASSNDDEIIIEVSGEWTRATRELNSARTHWETQCFPSKSDPQKQRLRGLAKNEEKSSVWFDLGEIKENDKKERKIKVMTALF